ncbi:4-oxalocrotonate tautomerase [Klebsiella quasipneumoniae]|nr:4-oxalocrotonate tautomerase [Klebsiella quasipneumoniae]
MVIEDTGLGLTRTRIWWWCGSIPARAANAQEAALLRHICRRSWRNTGGLSGDDLMVSIISNQKGDWSFGRGVAQYLTGDL